ncbi:MAG: glycosyltransferase, partial [Desulfovibrio sp.]|nr:glycosyltransferase [Desulfovibrio sp.]
LGATLFGDGFHAFHLPSNTNFGPACNFGAQKAKSPILFFLNNDTLATPGWAPPLLAGLKENPSIGAVGPLLLYANKTVQHVGVAFTIRNPIHLYRYFPSEHPVVKKRRQVQTLTAAALMLSREDFLSLGGFFPAYRNGFEDVDLCLRLIAQGKKLFCLPNSVIYHLESQTQGRTDHDDSNAKLLQARCGKLFRPDLHIHGTRDGFQPFIADPMDILLAMKADEEKALLASMQDQPLGVWQECMRQNPLWILGREHLAKLSEAQGEYTLALLLRSEIAFWRKNRKDFIKILDLRNRVGEESAGLMREAEKSLQEIEVLHQEKTVIRRTLRQLVQFKDPLLSQIYEKKVRELNL